MSDPVDEEKREAEEQLMGSGSDAVSSGLDPGRSNGHGSQAEPDDSATIDSPTARPASGEPEPEVPQYYFHAPPPILEPNPEPTSRQQPLATESTEATSPQKVEPPRTPNQPAAPADRPTDQPPRPSADAASGHSGAGQPMPDEQLVQQTKVQIRGLVAEIQRLAQSNCSVEEFNEGFLTRVTSALASVGGAIWKIGEQGRLELQYQVNVAATELAGDEKAQIAHDLLLRKIVQANEPALVPPHSGSGDLEDAANPTSCLLVIERLVVDQRIVGLVEIFQRAGSGPTTQRGYLRFLIQMCEIASDFLKNRKIRNYQQQQELWEKLEQFIRASHFGLDPKQTAYTVVNEGRRLVDCDRVSFARKEGSRYRVEVVSGLDSIDRRADEIKRLGELATVVARGEKPLWFNGDTEDLPPQIEKRVQAYVDRSHSKVVCVIPLRQTQREDIVEESESASHKRPRKEFIGALIFERLGDSRIDSGFRKRIEIVSAHASDALSNSIKHHGVFLMPLWQAIGRTRIFSRAALPRWAIVLSVLAILTGLLCFLPWDFELSAEGKLTPEDRYEIFSPLDGEIKWVIQQEPGKQLRVQTGDIVAELGNDDLRRELIELNNNITLELEKISEAEDQIRTQGPELTPVQELRLEQEVATSYARIAGYQNEKIIVEKKLRSLSVPATGNGLIVDWQLDEKLKNRQVSRGEKLMTIVDDSQDWIIEVKMLEKKFGHLVQAQNDFQTQNLKVTFVLVSLPNQQYEGTLVSVDRKADVIDETGNTVLLRIAFDKNEINNELLLYGTKVKTRIYCGSRPLGYILFREVYETLQRNVFFWF